jgi:predicted ATP-dependent endonuclease of OLD family
MQLRRLEIENFRGITKLDLAIWDTTVLIGENNTGKTAVLDALRFALRNIKTRRGCAFEEYDFHLPTASAEPSSSPAISIRLTFKEDQPGTWDRKVNHVNLRKEFFFASPVEVRELLKSKLGSLLEFTEHAEAADFHQSLGYWPEVHRARTWG